MSTRPNPRDERPSTYFVQDRANEDERTRVMLQDQLYTASMGGVLPEQPDPTAFRRVLDVGCGTGGWLIDVARSYPTMTTLVGVDISNKMVEYARAQVEAEGVSDRVKFQLRDVLTGLEFPDASFDLINQRLGASYLRTWDWSRIVMEYRRVVQAGGVIRISEVDLTESNGEAFNRLARVFLQALYGAGHYFTLDNRGLTGEIAPLLEKYGLRDVQTRVHHIEYRAGTKEGDMHAENMKYGFRTLLPFFRKWTRLPADYEELYQQMLGEMQRPDFVATFDMHTVWGTVPLR